MLTVGYCERSSGRSESCVGSSPVRNLATAGPPRCCPISDSMLLRQFDEAISLVEKALALDPNDPACHLAACRVLSMAGKPAEGIEHAKIAMRLDPPP